MSVPDSDLAAHLRLEQRHLLKANTDIDEGRRRVMEQTERLARLQAGGHDWRQANELLELFKQTLSEWERHRMLIEQRLDYLQRQLANLQL